MRRIQRMLLASTVGAFAMSLQTAESREHEVKADSSRALNGTAINLAQAVEPGAVPQKAPADSGTPPHPRAAPGRPAAPPAAAQEHPPAAPGRPAAPPAAAQEHPPAAPGRPAAPP